MRTLNRTILANLPVGGRILGWIICLALCFFLARLGFWVLKEPYRFSYTFSVALFIALFVSSKLAFWVVIFPICLLVGIYAPIAHIYGYPDYQAAVSLFSTNFAEAREFLSLISPKLYLMGMSVPLLAIITHWLVRRSGLKLWRNKTFIFVTVAYLLVVLNPSIFFDQLATTVKSQYAVSKFSVVSSWSQSKTDEDQKDFVLIIGESARKDYFHIYGYPVDDTPFLDKVNCVIVDGLSAGGIYTVSSLTNMLTAGNNWEPRYDRSIVDLAKSAGMKVIWITNNQGGLVDNSNAPITALSSQADEAIRVNGHLSYAYVSDFEMIDALKKVLQEKTDKSRLIILHTRGSHWNACSLVDKMPDKYEVKDKYYDYIACYVSSIKQTDQFIERTYDVLEHQKQLTGRPFSIIYFSDHGGKHFEKDGKLIILHGVWQDVQSKFIYDIPLVEIDSQQSERKEFKSRKSGFRFTEGLAHWMGIKNPDIADYDLFDGKDDQNDFGLSEKIKNAINDPAIDLTPLLKGQK